MLCICTLSFRHGSHLWFQSIYFSLVSFRRNTQANWASHSWRRPLRTPPTLSRHSWRWQRKSRIALGHRRAPRKRPVPSRSTRAAVLSPSPVVAEQLEPLLFSVSLVYFPQLKKNENAFCSEDNNNNRLVCFFWWTKTIVHYYYYNYLVSYIEILQLIRTLPLSDSSFEMIRTQMPLNSSYPKADRDTRHDRMGERRTILQAWWETRWGSRHEAK